LPARAVNAQTAATSIEVRLLDHRFVPDQIVARPGDRITFRNEDEDLHSVVLVGREDVIEETFIEPGEAHRFVLPDDLATGSYQLACTVHVDMRAELVVG
jgi:plastocyanin